MKVNGTVVIMFIQSGNLQADQMSFINTIITHLTKNGVIDKRILFDPPFTHIHDQGLFGMFDDADASKVIQLIDGVNGNVSVSGMRNLGRSRRYQLLGSYSLCRI